ncbi:MAG: hypothetical protein ACO3G4_00295 [Opitutaceae bacterium]
MGGAAGDAVEVARAEGAVLEHRGVKGEAVGPRHGDGGVEGSGGAELGGEGGIGGEAGLEGLADGRGW